MRAVGLPYKSKFGEEYKMEFCSKKFEELSTKELYEILKARSKVFIIEQNILYQDMDDIDYRSLHCFLIDNGTVIAYLRAYYTDEYCDTVKIGRVLTLQHGKGTGRELMKKSIQSIKLRMKCHKIIMDAQKHAKGFYEKFGFRAVSNDFLEEGVLHVAIEIEV